jgi:hypothetical protein
MTSINLVPTIKDILGGGSHDGSYDVSNSGSSASSHDGSYDGSHYGSHDGSHYSDICHLEKFREYYVDNIAIMYYKPGISNCGYNKQTYLKERLSTGEKSNGISASGSSSGSSSRSSSGSSSRSSSGYFKGHSIVPLDHKEEPLEEPLELPLEEPSDDIKKKAMSMSRAINGDKNTDFANSLFQMLSYIPEWYVLLEHSKHEYMKILKKLYDEIKKSDRNPISSENVVECLKQVLLGYSENSRHDPIEILKKILSDHKQFKIFNIKKKETFTCTHGRINPILDDMINESIITILNVPTIKGKGNGEYYSISELVTINSEMQLVKDGAKKQCKKDNSEFNYGFGPYRRNYEYDFSDTLYLIIYLKRGKYPSETHKISLCYNLNIQGTNFILEGYIIKEEPKDHYRYFKLNNEDEQLYHDEKTVYPRKEKHNQHVYQTQATILLYKKSLK